MLYNGRSLCFVIVGEVCTIILQRLAFYSLRIVVYYWFGSGTVDGCRFYSKKYIGMKKVKKKIYQY